MPSSQLSEDEKKAFLKNEERLWDLAAITAAPTLLQLHYGLLISPAIASKAYEFADALMAERRRRLLTEDQKPI